MRKILFAILLLQTIGCFSQNIKNEKNPYPVYCELIENGYIYIMFGSNSMLQSLYSEDGKKIDFASRVDAMNYLGKRGWKIVESYVSPQNVYSNKLTTKFIFMKMVTSEKEAKEGLYFESDYKNKK